MGLTRYKRNYEVTEMNECRYRLPCGICLITHMECLKNDHVKVVVQADTVVKTDTATSITPEMAEGEIYESF